MKKRRRSRVALRQLRRSIWWRPIISGGSERRLGTAWLTLTSKSRGEWSRLDSRLFSTSRVSYVYTCAAMRCDAVPSVRGARGRHARRANKKRLVLN